MFEVYWLTHEFIWRMERQILQESCLLQKTKKTRSACEEIQRFHHCRRKVETKKKNLVEYNNMVTTNIFGAARDGYEKSIDNVITNLGFWVIEI